MWRFVAFLLSVWLAIPVQAAQLTYSYKEDGSRGIITAQLIFCDQDGTPSNTQAGGESCTSGDWSKPLDARGYETCWFNFTEFGTGSGAAKVWNCKPEILDQTDWSTTAPGSAVSATHESACTEVALSQVSSGTFDGTNNTDVTFTATDIVPAIIIGEIDNCTDDCTSRLSAVCGPRLR